MTSRCWQISFTPQNQTDENFDEFLNNFFEVVSQNYNDDGFDEYYKYWVEEPETKLGENFWAKIINENATPVGVITIGLWEGVFTISEFIIRPDKRGKGIGTTALSELIVNGKEILGIEIEKARSVIYPNNIASQKAFEKAGFVFSSAHPDGDAWYYEYKRT